MSKKNPIGRPAIRGFPALCMALCCAQAAAANPGPAVQPAADSGPTLQEVVVTAETYTSTAQSTPISISALTGSELEGRGIRINALCPGAVATPLMGDDPHGWFAERGMVALEPEDLAATVVGLMDSDRSGEVVLHRPPWDPESLEFLQLRSC